MKKLVSAITAFFVLVSVFASFPAVTNAASTSDADFFAKFNYAAFPALSEVRQASASGDYTAAKQALLNYFKARHAKGEITGFGVSESDENYSMAVLPMRNILTGPYEFDMWQAEFTVTSKDYNDYSVDVTSRVAHELDNGAVSFMLFAGDKQQYPVYVKSKDAGTNVAPRLNITFERGGIQETVTVTADNDTYISSQDTSADNGSATTLTIKEDGSGSDSTGTNTRRTYINFPLSEAANSTIVSATLTLNAAYASDCTTGDKDVLVINIGDTVWSENSLTWEGTRGNIYSYQDAENPTWNASAPNCDSEYHNVTSRFWFAKPMAYEYLSYIKDPAAYDASHPYHETYPGEQFGPKLVSLMNAFANQMSHGWPRTLETGERLNRWIDVFDALLGTDVFDTRLDEFCNIVSFIWGDCSNLNSIDISNDSPWWSNWKIVANAGFFKAVEYFPEFAAHDAWREKVEYNVEYTLGILYNDDFSFKEAGPSYAAWCAKLFGDCVRAASMSGNPLGATTAEKVKLIARNALETYYPNGYDTNIGDSNYRDQMYYFEELDRIFDGSDNIIHAYVTGSGTNAEYLTHYYKQSNSAYMRNSWDPARAVYVNFTNNPDDGHCHPDSNEVLMYAYGQPLLVDSGRYSYSSTNSIYDTLRTAQSHNTIEAEGETLGKHTAATTADSLLYTATNNSFDFTASEQHGYTSVSHTRNVLFNRKGFAIVTDYVTGKNNTYRQNWHFLPSSNAEVSGSTVTTAFYQKPNVTVAAASADQTSVKDGYHSADYGLVASSKYASFEKTGETVKFDTLLYPTEKDQTAEISVTDLASSDNSKAAMQITIDGETSYYYVKNTDASDGAFGAYTTDAKMAYVSDSEYYLASGRNIAGLISAPNFITSVAVSVSGTTVAINGQDLAPSTDKTEAVAIYAPGASAVTLNGASVPFLQDGNFIYAAASNAQETVTVTETVKVYPDKDGFVKQDGTNEGSTTEYSDKLQAAVNDYNARNAYIAFDLSAYENMDISSAVLKMKMQENASAGNLHFYYLDYGTWTRDNLSFVLDSSKMPTHTNGKNSKGNALSEDDFKGYSYRWSQNVSGVANESWASLDTNLTSYLADTSKGGQYKFTWAILSQTGSARFYAGSAAQENLPYLEITYTYSKTIGEEKTDPTVETKIYYDGVPQTSTATAPIGSTVLFLGDNTVEKDGETYYLDSDTSTLSLLVKESGNTLEAHYRSANTITVDFSDVLGNTLADNVTVNVSPNRTSYTYTPPETIIISPTVYRIDHAASNLTCGATPSDLHAVYDKTGIIGNDNLVYNGDMSETTTENGYTFVTGWQGGYVNFSHMDLSNSPDLLNAGAYGATSKAVFNYTAASGTDPAYVTIPDSSVMNYSAIYPWRSDVSEPYMGLVLTSWIRDARDVNSYLTAEAGKTYYMSFDIKASSIASWQNNVVGFTAVTEDGDAYATKLPGTNGDIQTLTGVLDNPIGRSRYVKSADEWTTVETVATALSDGYFVFQLGWAHEWGQVSVTNFKICAVSDFEYATVTLDGKTVRTEGTLPLGETNDFVTYTLPQGTAGWLVQKPGETVGELYCAGVLNVSGGEIIETVPSNVTIAIGAQVRIGGGVDENGKIGDGSGLRFSASIEQSSMLSALNDGYGIEITPDGSEETLDIPAVLFQNDAGTVFTAAVVNLLPGNYNRSFNARAYVNVKYYDGTVGKAYSSETASRSIYYTAAGLLNEDATVSENNLLYNVLNSYVNMVGIRLSFTGSEFNMRTEGAGAYDGVCLFDAVSVKNDDGSYTVTVTPVAAAKNAVKIMSWWKDFVRINNNNTKASAYITDYTLSPDGSSLKFTFKPN